MIWLGYEALALYPRLFYLMTGEGEKERWERFFVNITL